MSIKVFIVIIVIVVAIAIVSVINLANSIESSNKAMKECFKTLKPIVMDACEGMGYDDGELFYSLGSYTRMVCINHLYDADFVSVEERQLFKLEYTCDPPNITSARLWNP